MPIGSMKVFYRGLLEALLCAALALLLGCAREEPLYTSGSVREDTASSEDAARETEAQEEAAAPPEGAPGTEANSPPGYVYVCGAVMDAAVVPISDDMRICDAIALAGGFSPEADQEWLNQAERVCDGQKIYVYTLEETRQFREAGLGVEGEGIRAGTDTGTDAAADGKVNLNTATREQLMTLPGIGEAKADAILAYRMEHGSFSSIEEIQNISGIKSGVFSKIQDLITV